MNTPNYCFSHDGENYHGSYTTPGEAARDGFNDTIRNTIWVAESCPPIQPEDFINADLLIEHCQVQDEYCNDWCEGWPDVSKESTDELTAVLRKTFAEWLDKHQARPHWYDVKNERKYTREEVGCSL